MKPSEMTNGTPWRYRLKLLPSPSLVELVAPLFKPSIREQRLAKLALYSTTAIDTVRLARSREVYYPEDMLRPKNEIQHLGRVATALSRQQLPLLSVFETENVEPFSPKDSSRVFLYFALPLSLRRQLGSFNEFEYESEQGYVKTQFTIASPDIMPNASMRQGALENIHAELGINHPARKGLALSALFVGEKRFGTIAPEAFQGWRTRRLANRYAKFKLPPYTENSPEEPLSNIS